MGYKDKSYEQGVAEKIINQDNMDKTNKIVKLNEWINSESNIVNAIESMIDSQKQRVDGNGLKDNNVTISIKDDYRDIRMIFRMDDANTAISDLEMLLGVHKDRLTRYNNQLDVLLNGEYNRLVDHVKLAVGGDK